LVTRIFGASWQEINLERESMKKLLPTLLLTAVISGSLFMILESGEYYQKFYKNEYQGYWAAFLVESFLAIAAMLNVKNKKLLNWIIKLVMFPLFLVMVCGASLKIISPLVKELAIQENQLKLIALLNVENQQSIHNLEYLKGQKINTAVEVRRQRQSTKELKNIFYNNNSFSWMIWIVIGFSTFLRFSVQIANLTFAYTLGELWRQRNIIETEVNKVNFNSHSNIRFESKSLPKKTDLKALNEKNQINPTSKSNIQTQLEKVIKYLKRNGGKATRLQILSSRILKGGVEEYDVILSLLERHRKIKADRKQDSKKLWVYYVV
jgi:hypothetical protein